MPALATALAPDLAALVAFVAAGLALAAGAAALRRLAGRKGRTTADGEPAAAAAPRRDSAWRAAAALAAAVGAGGLLAPALVALRQLYPLPDFGSGIMVLLLALLALIAAAIVALLLSDPWEDL